MSSTGAVEEFMGVQPYNALKAAVIAYSAALSQTLAAEGTRVNCITPGPVWTEDGPWVQIKEHMREFYDGIVAQLPLGKLTSGEDMAKTIVFTASPRARHDGCQYRRRQRTHQAHPVLGGAMSLGVQGIHHIGVSVPDIDKARNSTSTCSAGLRKSRRWNGATMPSSIRSSG